jgi:AcrR family transcriptional regulator
MTDLDNGAAILHRGDMTAAAAESAQPPINWGDPGDDLYGIGDVVRITAVPASSIHHYLRLGLIPEPQRLSARQFRYDDRHVAAINIIRSLRARGCSLDEIRDVLPELLHAYRGRAPGGDAEPELDEFVSDRHPPARLIDAAIDAFAEHSFREVSIADLCERAEVAKATFYRWYDSKEALFLAAARAVVERAIDGFSAEAPDADPTRHTAIFAGYLRRGLPVLFELAKRITQETGPTASESVTLFADLARRLGRVVNPDADEVQGRQAGGLLIMLAVVDIFQGLMRDELKIDEDS